MKIFNKRNNPQKAFTLIEALVAISVLMVAITGPMILAQKSLSEADLAKDQSTASFLAQDGIEAVLNIRDQIAISQTSGDWLTGTNNNGLLYPCVCNLSGDNCNFDSKYLVYCTIDSTSPTWVVNTNSPINSISPGSSQVPPLTMTYSINPSTGAKSFLKYGYDTANGTSVIPSKFTRYINIEEDPAGNKDEALISVLVTWNSPLGLQKIPLQRFIYNYSENL
jgi:Tfp pilus assembly protein PilV